MAPGLSDIDWRQPWLADWASAGQRVLERIDGGMPALAALNAEPGLPVRLVGAADLPAGVAYERHVGDTLTVPTREGLHDFFNALCWMHLPRTRLRMNALHCADTSLDRPGMPRGPVRDALTLFDENGAVLHAPAELWQALRARDWRQLFVTLRPLWTQARLTLVGHALAEKLVLPRKDITAHVWAVPAPAGGPGVIDEWLCTQLDAGRLAGKPFVPLQILGIPGWWHANESPLFYDDAHVFRRPDKHTLKAARNPSSSRGAILAHPTENP